jgi:5-methylcytosine-specific restriction endonuclease McrA
MTSDPPEPPSLFDGFDVFDGFDATNDEMPASFEVIDDTDDADNLVADLVAQTAREETARARLSLSSAASAKALHLSETERWRRFAANPRRPIVPRPKINDAVRLHVFTVADHACASCLQHGNDVGLHVGHVLSLAEAQILTHITGDPRPWRLASTYQENWFAECAKCNPAHRDISYGPAEALTLLGHQQARSRRIRGGVLWEILQWLDRAQQWRPGTDRGNR